MALGTRICRLCVSRDGQEVTRRKSKVTYLDWRRFVEVHRRMWNKGGIIEDPKLVGRFSRLRGGWRRVSNGSRWVVGKKTRRCGGMSFDQSQEGEGLEQNDGGGADLEAPSLESMGTEMSVHGQLRAYVSCSTVVEREWCERGKWHREVAVGRSTAPTAATVCVCAGPHTGRGGTNARSASP